MGDDMEPQVSYGLKEILTDINRKLDDAIRLIHSKADAAVVEAMDGRLRQVETHIEHAKEHKASTDHKREWLIPVLLTAAYTIIVILQAFHL